MINQSIHGIAGRLGMRGALVAFACVAGSGCRDSLNKLLAVQAPGRVIADSLNGRPRETLGWMTPSEKLAEVLVALTG